MLFANPDDLLNLSDNDAVVLMDSGGGLRQDVVEHLDEFGKFLPSRTKLLRPRYEHRASYKLFETGGLSFVFGALVNTYYMLTGLDVVQDPEGKPVIATASFIKLTNVNKFNTDNAVKFTVDVAGGYGIVDAFGCTIASPGDITEARMTVSTQSANVLNRADGDFQQAGYVIYGGNIRYGMSATGAITLPTGNIYQNDGDERRGESAIRTFAANWIGYPDYD